MAASFGQIDINWFRCSEERQVELTNENIYRERNRKLQASSFACYELKTVLNNILILSYSLHKQER